MAAVGARVPETVAVSTEACCMIQEDAAGAKALREIVELTSVLKGIIKVSEGRQIWHSRGV